MSTALCDRCGVRVAAIFIEDSECLGCRENDDHCDPRLATDGGVRDGDDTDGKTLTITLEFEQPVTKAALRGRFQELADRLIDEDDADGLDQPHDTDEGP